AASIRSVVRRRLCRLLFLPLRRPPPSSTLFPYTTLFRSRRRSPGRGSRTGSATTARTASIRGCCLSLAHPCTTIRQSTARSHHRSEEHTSELQSPYDLVCRLLLEKKKRDRQTRAVATVAP